jgi:hypothetical protein
MIKHCIDESRGIHWLEDSKMGEAVDKTKIARLENYGATTPYYEGEALPEVFEIKETYFERELRGGFTFVWLKD